MSADGLPPTLDALLAETRWIQALARSLVVDPGTADDVAQDAAVVALTNPPRDAGALRSWLRRVVRNLALNARRGAVRREGRERLTSLSEQAEAADEVVARWEVRRRVVEAVLALDEPYRATILLRFFEGRTAAETAARLGVPLETVRTRTRRGLDVLRGRLANLEDGRGRRGAAVLLVLAGAERRVPGSAGAAASGSAIGGTVMATGTKWAFAAAALVTLGVGAAWVANSAPVAPPGAPGGAPTDSANAAAKPRRASPSADQPADASGGVDLDACDRERDLFGVVVDPDGKPVAGAAVTVLRRRPFGAVTRTFDAWNPYVAAEATKSAPDGTFALRLGDGDGVGLRVDASGFALWESADRQAGERVTVRLARAMTLDVRVRSHDEKPVAGAHVIAESETTVDRVARTDANGLATFPRLPRSTKAFVTVAPDTAPGAFRQVELADAETQTLVVTLDEGRTVRGVVVDAATRTPIGGAHVGYGEGFGDAARTDAAGRFEVAGVSDATGMSVHAEADGYARDFADARASDDVRIALSPAVRVTGRVLDPDRRPLKDADVVLFGTWMLGVEHRSLGGAVTAADGTFAVDGLTPGRPHRLTVNFAGLAELSRAVEMPEKSPYVVDLGDVVLSAAHTLRGTVVDPRGAPVARVEVDMRRSDVFTTSDPRRQRRHTDDLGRFTFPDLAPAVYRVEVASEKGRETAEVIVPETGDPPPLTIRLGAKAESKGQIPVGVHVADENGNPLAGVKIQLGYAANGATPTLASAADGAIAFAAEFEPATVSAYLDEELAKTHLPVWQLLRPGQRELSVIVRRGRTVSGRALYDDGKPVSDGGVTAWVGATRVGGGSTNQQGEFAFAVPPGTNVDLEATPPNVPRELWRSAGELRGVAPGAEGLVVHVVREPATRAIDVEVVDDAGAPVTGAWIQTEFKGEDWQRPLCGTTATDGRCRIDSLPRAPVIVSAAIRDVAAGPNHSWTPRAVRASGDQDTVRIVVPKPRVLRGRVVGEDGAPVAEAFVHASPGTARGGSVTMAGPDGRFEILVPPDAPLPFLLHGNPLPFDRKKPLTGWDLVDASDRELEIVVHPVPAR